MTFALMTPRTKQGYKSSRLVEWGWQIWVIWSAPGFSGTFYFKLHCSLLTIETVFFAVFLFFSSTYNMKVWNRPKTWDWLNFITIWMSFTDWKDSTSKSKSTAQCVCWLLFIRYLLIVRSYLYQQNLTAPHTCKDFSDINIFNMHFLYYISSVQNMTPCWSAARKHQVSCSCRLIVTKTPPMPATTCKHHLCCSRKAEEETKKSKRKQTKRRGRFWLHSWLPKNENKKNTTL